MDGLEATKAIRAGACGSSRSRVPVVAITAQAMEGDREAFLGAGMNDYVTKPVDLDEILLVLARHAPLKKRPEASEMAPSSSDSGDLGAVRAPDGDKTADSGGPTEARSGETGQGVPAALQGSGESGAAPSALFPLLDREGALARLKGMTILLEAMESTFLRATPEDLTELARAAQAGDAAGVKLYAHRVKGNSAGVGATRLSEAAREIELEASGGGVPGAEALQRLEELFALTSAEMALVKDTGGTGQN